MATAIGTYATLAGVKARLGLGDTVDDTLLSSLCDQINAWIETTTGRILAPLTFTAELFDGDGSRVLPVARGIRSVTLLEVAPYTGAPYVTVSASDIFLRPVAQQRAPGWPPTEIWLSDVPSPGNVYPYFPAGLATVRITGTGGWAALPDEVIEIATTTVVRAWHARQSGQADIVGTDETGAPIVSRYVSLRDRITLREYELDLPVIV